MYERSRVFDMAKNVTDGGVHTENNSNQRRKRKSPLLDCPCCCELKGSERSKNKQPNYTTDSVRPVKKHNE